MTGEEFLAAYAKRSGMTVEAVQEYGLRAVPCSCDYEHCEGWVVLNRDPRGEA